VVITYAAVQIMLIRDLVRRDHATARPVLIVDIFPDHGFSRNLDAKKPRRQVKIESVIVIGDGRPIGIGVGPEGVEGGGNRDRIFWAVPV
jgi:hypothetical protein